MRSLAPALTLGNLGRLRLVQVLTPGVRNLPRVNLYGTDARVDATYELFDHTADMGLRVRAGSLGELLEPAAQALYAAIGSLEAGGQLTRRRIELSDGDAAELLRDFLTELLVMFERESLIVTRLEEVSFTNERLSAELIVSKVNPDQSSFQREVKAITYHELEIRSIDGGVEATVIVDI